MEENLRPFEKALVIGAVISSFVVVSFETASSRRHPTRLADTIYHSAIAIGGIAAFFVCVVACVLIAIEGEAKITTGVFSATMIGLIPAASVMPKIKYNLIPMAWRSCTDPSLRGMLSYMRIGRPPTSIPNCSATLYIRDEAALERVKHLHPVVEWYGIVWSNNEDYVGLRDQSDGESKRWWYRAQSLDIMCDPSLAALETWQQARNAQALVADLVVVGDLLLSQFTSSFKAALRQNEGIRTSFTSSVGTVCQRFLVALGLEDWMLPPEGKDCVPDWPDKGSRSQKYRVIFNILAEKSRLFDLRPGINGLGLVDKLLRDGSDAMQHELMIWVKGWGFDADKYVLEQ